MSITCSRGQLIAQQERDLRVPFAENGRRFTGKIELPNISKHYSFNASLAASTAIRHLTFRMKANQILPHDSADVLSQERSRESQRCF